MNQESREFLSMEDLSYLRSGKLGRHCPLCTTNKTAASVPTLLILLDRDAEEMPAVQPCLFKLILVNLEIMCKSGVLTATRQSTANIYSGVFVLIPGTLANMSRGGVLVPLQTSVQGALTFHKIIRITPTLSSISFEVGSLGNWEPLWLYEPMECPEHVDLVSPSFSDPFPSETFLCTHELRHWNHYHKTSPPPPPQRTTLVAALEPHLPSL